MKPGQPQPVSILLRNGVPLASTFGLLLLMVVPNRIPGAAGIMPMFVWMAVFYWAIFRPDLLPAWLAFAVGLLFDALAGLPLGINALVLLLLHAITASQRRFFLGNTFIVAWWGFSMLAAAALLMVAGLTFVAASRWGARDTLLLQYALTVCLYPAVAWGLARSQVVLLRQG